MCVLVILRNRVAGWPVVVGENRDEFRDRPWEPPRPDADLLAPRDMRAGGTWLAVSRRGLLVAVTNLPEDAPDSARPSRGLLALSMARAGDAEAAAALAREELARSRRNAFQALVADAVTARVIVHPGRDGAAFDEVLVPAGVHTLTNFRRLDELDDEGVFDPVRADPEMTLDAAVARLSSVLAAHRPAGREAVCKHGASRGTLSSAIVALPAPGGAAPRLLFAAGAPCETPFLEVPFLEVPFAPGGAAPIRLVLGDITTLAVDAIVNAANERLARGGGVCGAIYAKAGPQLDEFTDQMAPIRTGEAVATPGFDLRARLVIHAVGPVWRGGGYGEARDLAAAYGNALRVAAENGCRSIAFPFLSAGIYGYPKEEAAAIAVETVRSHPAAREMDVTFCLFSAEDHGLFEAKLRRAAVRSASAAR